MSTPDDLFAAESALERPFSVSEITAQVKGLLEENLPMCWVLGEISNYTHHASGHRYFTLKDQGSQLSCVLFKWQGQNLTFDPQVGMQVMAHGHVTVYERSGRYQFLVGHLQPAGVGELALAFEQLKTRLEEEGLFDPERKRALPPFPRAIGVVTSPTGAAIRDIVNVLQRRAPGLQIVLRPARVQGAGASVVSPPAPLDRPGGGYGFSVLHPEGWTIAISSDVETHADAEDAIDRPRRFSHVALGAEDAEAACAFMVDNFGLRVSDRNGVINFLRCDANHHSIAFAHTGAAYVHHVSYDMPNFDALMRGAGRMKEMGYPLEWGIGRHGPGDNIFSYFIEPNGFMNEYTAEMHQVDEATYKTGTPEEWKRPENRRDQWGFADPPSEAMQKTQASHALLPAG